MIIGIIASTIYQVEKVTPMRVGDELQLGKYLVRMVGLREVVGPNWEGNEGVFEVYEDGRFVAELLPQKRIYSASQTPTTEAAIHRIGLGHLFITIPEVTPEGVFMRGLINPLVLLVWGGGGIMGLGVLLNIFRPKRKDS